MDAGKFFNDNISKKMGVALSTIAALVYVGAHPGYIIAVAIVEILVQGYLDKKEAKNGVAKTNT